MSDLMDLTDNPTSFKKELLMAHLNDTVSQLFPDFSSQMTPDYFHAVDVGDQVAHMCALATTEIAGIDQELLLTSNNAQCYTFINRKNYSGLLSKLIKRLPSDRPLQAAKIFTSLNGDIVIDIFDFAAQRRFDPSDPEHRERLDQLIHSITEYEPELAIEDLIRLLQTCSEDYVLTTSDRRLCRHFRMVEKLWGTDDVHIDVLPRPDSPYLDITIGFGNGDTRKVFERVSQYLGRHSIDIHRAHFESFEREDQHRVALLGLLVSNADGSVIETDTAAWHKHRQNLTRVPVMSDEITAIYEKHHDLTLLQVECLCALSALLHQRLCKVDAYRYTLERISESVIKHKALSCTIVDYVIQRFAPENSKTSDITRSLLDEEPIHSLSETDAAILRTLEMAALSILKTNLHFPQRYALSFRIDPEFLCVADRITTPHGVFFFYGKNFTASHIRFRDIARGGMRIVRPRNQDDYLFETARLFDENYALAYAQQLKNKDIPEGGSKGVLLTKPDSDYEQCGRAYADSLLDLITPDPAIQNLRIDYLGVDEWIYLGPDENVAPPLIDWIIQRAHRRGYPQPNTFMSSKAAAGINHKDYGVTSEGVSVFLDTALREVGINPNQETFTVKITGGPDGDVAGNEILILHREYGENARIVGIADGSGTAEDPDGLDHAELIRLVKESAPISEFAADKLGPNGVITNVESPEGIHARNTLHFRLQADAFIPAGGRPQAINSMNWDHYLDHNGKPSSRIIVEGANLFITADARQKLADAGVLIIKDSSANKCGVICSSMEILAGMLVSEDEFSEIKADYVDEVLHRLRELAALEAKALLHAHRHHPQISLPELSKEMSLQINRLHDAVAQFLTNPAQDSGSDFSAEINLAIEALVRNYVPLSLREEAGDDAITRIPLPYFKQIVASVLASRMVYQEGIDYCRHMGESAMAKLAMQYLKEEARIASLIDELRASNVERKDAMIHLLRQAGAGAALKV